MDKVREANKAIKSIKDGTDLFLTKAHLPDLRKERNVELAKSLGLYGAGATAATGAGYGAAKVASRKFIDKSGEAKSKSQQRLMGMAYAYRKGELDTSSLSEGQLKKVKEVANSMSMKDLKEYAETKHKKNMPEKKAEYVFNKIAFDAFEEGLDNRMQMMLSKVDRHNKHVKSETAKGVGASAAAGAGLGAVSKGVYDAVTNKSVRKALKGALRGGGYGAAAGALAGSAYILPKAFKAYVSRGEERKLRDALDARHDMAREYRIRRGAQKMRNMYEGR